MKTIYAVTGHRTARCFSFYNEGQFLSKKIQFLNDFSLKLLKEIKESSKEPFELMTGMAQGFDMSCAKGAIKLGIPHHAAVPFIGQESMWPEKEQLLYGEILDLSKTIHVVSEGGYSVQKFYARNEYMGDNSSGVFSLWDGIKTGGTHHMIRYCERKKIPYNNYWSDWEDFYLSRI